MVVRLTEAGILEHEEAAPVIVTVLDLALNQHELDDCIQCQII